MQSQVLQRRAHDSVNTQEGNAEGPMKKDIMKEENTIWQNNGGTGDNIISLNNQVINVCKANQNDKPMFDVYVSLKTMPQERLLIQITQR